MVTVNYKHWLTRLLPLPLQATALHFSSDYKAVNNAFYSRQYYAHTLSLTCSEDIFSSESPARAEVRLIDYIHAYASMIIY